MNNVINNQFQFDQNLNYYVTFPNTVFMLNEKQRMNIEEIFIFAYLHMRRNFHTKTVITNLAIMDEEIKLVQKKADNIMRIIKSLKSLRNKGYIYFDEHNDKSIKRANVINITVMDLKKEKEEKGFVKLYYKTLEHVENPLQYAILLYVESIAWKQKEIPYSQFSQVLLNYKDELVTDKTIRNEIKDLEDRGILLVYHGEYYCVNEQENEWKQAINKYELNDNPEDYINDDITKTRITPFKSLMNEKELRKEASQLIDRLPEKIDYKLYYWLKTFDNPYLFEIANKVRLKPMRDGGFDFTKWDELFKKEQELEQLENEEKKIIRDDSTLNVFMDTEEREFSKYVKRKDKSDISSFVDDELVKSDNPFDDLPLNF